MKKQLVKQSIFLRRFIACFLLSLVVQAVEFPLSHSPILFAQDEEATSTESSSEEKKEEGTEEKTEDGETEPKTESSEPPKTEEAPPPVVENPKYEPLDKKDPFEVLVKKQIILPQEIKSDAKSQTVVKPSAPKPPPVPPVNISVMGIVGNDSKRIALVSFENETLSLNKGFTDKKGKFKVVDIEKDKVIIYSFKEGFRKTFKLNEVKAEGGEGGGGDEGSAPIVAAGETGGVSGGSEGGSEGDTEGGSEGGTEGGGEGGGDHPKKTKKKPSDEGGEGGEGGGGESSY